MSVLLVLLYSCAQPDPCPEMCSTSTQIYGGCLSAWGADWQDAGYEDANAYFHACETWVWEMRLIEKKAKSNGDIEALGHVDGYCEDVESKLSRPDVTCDDWTEIDWKNQPW